MDGSFCVRDVRGADLVEQVSVVDGQSADHSERLKVNVPRSIGAARTDIFHNGLKHVEGLLLVLAARNEPARRGQRREEKGRMEVKVDEESTRELSDN